MRTSPVSRPEYRPRDDTISVSSDALSKMRADQPASDAPVAGPLVQTSSADPGP